jgi:hypothetical protein
MNFMATKKVTHFIFFLFLLLLGPGIPEIWKKSCIRNKHPGSATLPASQRQHLNQQPFVLNIFN